MSTLAKVLDERDLLNPKRKGGFSEKSPIYYAFKGFRKLVGRSFNIPEPAFVHNNEVRLLSQQTGREANIFPFSYASITNIGLADGQNANVQARIPVAHKVDDSDTFYNAMYQASLTLDVELHYVTQNFEDALAFAMAYATIGSTANMNYSVQVADVKHIIKVVGTGSVQFPKADKENQAYTDAFDVIASFTLRVPHVSFMDIPKLKTVTFNSEVL